MSWSAPRFWWGQESRESTHESIQPPWGPHPSPKAGHLQQGAGGPTQKQDWGLSYLGVLHCSHRVGEAGACRDCRHTHRPWNTDPVTVIPFLLVTSGKTLPLKDPPIRASPAHSPLLPALTGQAGHCISGKDGCDFMACVHDTDTQLLAGHQQWGYVPTNQGEEEPHIVGPQHSCHVLPTMLDACLVHLGTRAGKSKAIKAQGKGASRWGKGNPTPLGRGAGAGS